MSDVDVRLVLGLVLFAFGLGCMLGRAAGRREVATTLLRASASLAAARRARNAQDASEHRDVFRDLPGLSDAERAAWDARELA